jgi:hypothetical protein
MKNLLFTNLLILLAFGAVAQEHSEDELVRRAAETDIEHLPYTIEKIVVRGFDGSNPPPRLVETTRPMLYGYGITAYHMSYDSLIFFKVVAMKAVHRNSDGSILKSFEVKNGRYSQEFKEYFLERIRPEERQDIWFEEIYISDKKDNIIYLAEPQKFCPHCI